MCNVCCVLCAVCLCVLCGVLSQLSPHTPHPTHQKPNTPHTIHHTNTLSRITPTFNSLSCLSLCLPQSFKTSEHSALLFSVLCSHVVSCGLCVVCAVVECVLCAVHCDGCILECRASRLSIRIFRYSRHLTMGTTVQSTLSRLSQLPLLSIDN